MSTMSLDPVNTTFFDVTNSNKDYEIVYDNDRHGMCNIILEPFLNVRYDNSTNQIIGVTLNNLLRGLWLLLGSESSRRNYFISQLGGTSCWEAISGDTIYITILTLMDMKEIFNRIFRLIPSRGRKLDENDTKDIELILLLEGSLYFLHNWISKYDCYIDPNDLQEYRVGCHDVFEKCQNASYLIDFKDSILTKIADVIDTVEYIIIKRSYHDRHNLTSNQISLQVLSGSSENVSHSDNSIKILNKIQFSKAPTYTLDVFGGGQLSKNVFDDESDDGRDDPTIVNSKNQTNNCRLPIGFFTYQDPASINNLWMFDSIELARQWCIIDHTMLRSIPLSSFIIKSKPLWSLPRYMRHVPELRSFIDRFNSTALWTTASVLSGNTPEERAIIYSNLVTLAINLEKLHNYNSVMAVISGLTQGSITRLKHTLGIVQKTDSERFKQLQILEVLMKANKNCQNYRDRVAEVMLHYDDVSVAKDISGIVPYVGCHLSELVSIVEGNSDHIVDAPYLLNIHKKYLMARCVSFIGKMQKQEYSFQPIRFIGIVINRKLREYIRLTPNEGALEARRLFEYSLQIEPEEEQEQYDEYVY